MSGALGAYRASTALYPRAFRADYREDMVALAAKQLAEGRHPLVALRLVRDLLISIPSQHLEHLMNRPAPLLLTTLSTGVAVMSTGTAALLGSAVSFPLLAVAVIAAAIAWGSYSTARAVHEPQLSRHWWRLVLGGAALLGVLVGAEALGAERIGLPWLAAVALVLGGWGSIATGVVLGVVHGVRSRRQGGPAVS